jgi:hypothetical protein
MSTGREWIPRRTLGRRKAAVTSDFQVELDGIEPTTSSLPGGADESGRVSSWPRESTIHLHLAQFHLDTRSHE